MKRRTRIVAVTLLTATNLTLFALLLLLLLFSRTATIIAVVMCSSLLAMMAAKLIYSFINFVYFDKENDE